MVNPTLHDVRTWNRGCYVAIHVYRLLNAVPDRPFAERVITNAFKIPEGIATALNSHLHGPRDGALEASLEALVVLQTQLYLATECGLVDNPGVAEVSHAAAALVEDLLAERDRRGHRLAS